MKSLTVRQPWASLIANGSKTIETRSRPTKYRGPLVIHAGLAKPPPCKRCGGSSDIGTSASVECPTCAANGIHQFNRSFDCLHSGLADATLPLGAVVAVAELVDCVPIHSIDGDLPYEPHLLVDEPGGLVHRALTDDVLGCPMRETRIDDQVPYGDFTLGRWAWMLSGARPLVEPYQMQGHQGLRDVPPDWENQILAAVV